MSEQAENKIESNALRKKAEEKLRRITGKRSNLSPEDLPRIIHDLEVHEIELEMQNEELRQSHATLEKSRAKYSDLYDFAPVGYFTFDRNGLILETNLTGASLLGTERANLINKPFGLFIEKKYHDKFYLHCRKVFDSPDRQTCDIKIKKKDGSEFYAHLESIRFEDTDGRTICKTSIIDMTEHMRLEDEQQKIQKLDSIGILAGGIAHDFNNLLAAMINNVFLAKQTIDNENEAQEHLNSLEKAIVMSTTLTRQLLTFSKGGAPVKTTCSIIDIIRESAEFALRGSNIKCEYNLPGDLWSVEVDEGQMNQVIHNLIINASQAMPEGGTIQISAENFEPGKDAMLPSQKRSYTKISIRDRGTGITDEHLQKIFDPYFSTKEMGRGLGLSVVYSIIKKHDGHIFVESELGVGTVFIVYLPASDRKVEEKAAAATATSKGEGKILLMDDEEVVRDATGQILTHMGFKVESVKDGEEALALYNRALQSPEPYDAVILDLTIRGGMGGEETIKKMLQLNPDVKAIASSGYSNDPVMAGFRDYGFSAIHFKGSGKPEDLCRILNRLITK